ncbi:MAG TPA: FAD-linked oxidase C-terminal domain-containing protein [Longimicrobiales bacterium]|nr:FAD-linked oxidase C-terminal domain-containing protein [Longimicrobiales bacterium]
MAGVTLPPPLDAGLAAELRALLGDEGVLTSPSEMLVYESDGLVAYRVPPRAVILPRDTAETAFVLRALAEQRIPFVARGAGTGLSGGALALEEAVVVSTARMGQVLELDAANRRARVQPGVINAELSRLAAPHGLYFAPDPSSQSACTLGGNVAENAGGPHCLKYGVTTDHVLALTVVMPDGSVLEMGGDGETIGYDLVGLWVGSEGTFGIATELTLALASLPEARATMLAIFDRLDDASHAVSDVIGAGLLPAALEMIDQATIRAVEASIFAAGYPVDAAAALVIEFDGARAGLDEEAARAADICTARGAREVRLANDDTERDALWRGRKKAFGALGRLAPELLVQDAVVPRTALPRVLARVMEIGAEHGLRIANVFHAGDGNLHPCILFDRRDPDQLERVERASREMMRVCVEAGGTVTGEHGIGLDKREYMNGLFDEPTLQAMCSVKRVFDPAGLANPAKVLPVRVCREWVGPATRVKVAP